MRRRSGLSPGQHRKRLGSHIVSSSPRPLEKEKAKTQKKKGGGERFHLRLKNWPGPYRKNLIRWFSRRNFHFCSSPWWPKILGLFWITPPSVSATPGACRHRAHSRSTTVCSSQMMRSLLRKSKKNTTKPKPTFTS